LSCHDPHNYPAAHEKLTYYRQRCLTCHEESGCGLDMAERRIKDPADNCIACHMSKVVSSNVAHTAITDHRIIRAPGKERPDARDLSSPEKYPLVPFFHDETDFSNPETKRDLGIALIKLASQRPPRELARLALPLLDIGLQPWPDDVPALEAKGFALSYQGKPEEALDAFMKALQLVPDRERSVFAAAQLNSQLGRNETAVTLWQRAIHLNPWNWQYHEGLAKAYANQQEWKEAALECQETLKLNMAALETRKLFVECLLRLGEKGKAQKEFTTLLDFDPPDRQRLKDWFLEHTQ
jgi:tetratricopeptide (TPR) repeat protein